MFFSGDHQLDQSDGFSSYRFHYGASLSDIEAKLIHQSHHGNRVRHLVAGFRFVENADEFTVDVNGSIRTYQHDVANQMVGPSAGINQNWTLGFGKIDVGLRSMAALNFVKRVGYTQTTNVDSSEIDSSLIGDGYARISTRPWANTSFDFGIQGGMMTNQHFAANSATEEEIGYWAVASGMRWEY